MKNFAIIILLGLSLFSCKAQETKYQNVMEKAITTLNKAENQADLQKANNQFQRIAQMKANDWLPVYYSGLSNAYLSFGSQENKDELADKALESVEKALKLAITDEDKAEIYVLQGLAYTAKLVVDPMSRGQQYSMLSSRSYGQAAAMDATNPRTKLMQIQNELGAAKFFKQDVAPMYEKAKDLLAIWDDFKPKSSIHPNWGRKMVAEMAAKATSPVIDEKKTTNEATTATPPVIDGENSIEVEITQLRSNDGVILLRLLNTDKKVIDKKVLTIENNKAVTKFTHLKAGKYVIRYFHDEDNNKKMAKGMFGIPKEGYGSSNDARGNYGPPKFNDMIFEVKGATKMIMKTKYH